MVLDGKQQMDVKVEVQIDVAAQNFQLTVVEVGAPEGFQNLGSRCGAVFVDEAAEEVVAFDRPGA